VSVSPTRDDAGAVSALELVLVTPVFLALVVFVVFCGRMGRSAQAVRALAAAAARAASLERSPDAARAAASRVAGAPNDSDLVCTPPTVAFGSDGTVDTVTVTVRCQASLSGLALLPLAGSHTFSATSTEPVDRFRGD
jgi:Flp pilus assembly protein TadG